jgi:hypothetical protein
MNQRDYDRLERLARDEMDRGIRLIRAAHESKINAIRVLRMMGAQQNLPTEPISQDKPPPLKPGKLQRAFSEIFEKLPDEFGKETVLTVLRVENPEVAQQVDSRAISGTGSF